MAGQHSNFFEGGQVPCGRAKSVAEDEQVTIARIMPQRLLHHQCQARKPFLMSVRPVASHTCTPFGTGIIAI